MAQGIEMGILKGVINTLREIMFTVLTTAIASPPFDSQGKHNSAECLWSEFRDLETLSRKETKLGLRSDSPRNGHQSYNGTIRDGWANRSAVKEKYESQSKRS